MVDDAIVDGTWEVLERMRAAAPAAVTALRQSPNRGKAEAVRAGILVERIARYRRLPVDPGGPPRRDRLYELVLPAWHDKPGSKLRRHDFARAMLDLGYIWRERRPPLPRRRCCAGLSEIVTA